MTPTEQFIGVLEDLKPGDLGRLRQSAGLPLDDSVAAFDLFAGLWWPLRQRDQRAPRREVAWLVAKLYGSCPMGQWHGATLASSLGRIRSGRTGATRSGQQRFDDLLTRDLSEIESALRWAAALVRKSRGCVDWVRLTDDLSVWERLETRVRWARQFQKQED